MSSFFRLPVSLSRQAVLWSRPSAFCAICVAASLIGFRVADASGAPVRLAPFELVPRASVLSKTDGDTGVGERYQLTGSYDFVSGPEYDFGATPPSVAFQALFKNAEIWGSRILPPGVFAPAIVEDVDFLLNLEGLSGELLPLGAPFDVYRFTGLANDSAAASPLEQSSVDLLAAQVGRWMFLYGETTPPPGSLDRPEYTIRALARRGPWADMNGDGVVDAADYTAMRDASGANAGGATPLDWRTQFGETLPDMATMGWLEAFASSSAEAIPEPGAVTLLAAAAIALKLGPRTRRCGCRL